MARSNCTCHVPAVVAGKTGLKDADFLPEDKTRVLPPGNHLTLSHPFKAVHIFADFRVGTPQKMYGIPWSIQINHFFLAWECRDVNGQVFAPIFGTSEHIFLFFLVSSSLLLSHFSTVLSFFLFSRRHPASILPEFLVHLFYQNHQYLYGTPTALQQIYRNLKMNEDIMSRLRANDPTLDFVSICPVFGISLHEFCSSVQENSRIRRLSIRDVNIGTIDANELSTALGRMPLLEEFYIIRCPWESVEVAMTLASSLAGRCTLQKLRLSECNIDDGCVRAISTSFIAHQSLQTIYIDGNPIGNVGAIAIGSLFASNESLKVVDLRSSNIGDDGFEAIARGIAQSRTLEWLRLSNNAADFESIQDAFKRALYNGDSIEAVLTGSNHTLKCIDFVGDIDLCLLLVMNGDGPEKARRWKLLRFLVENPGFVVLYCRALLRRLGELAD